MNEAREGESCAIHLTECCCGEGNSAPSRRGHPARSWAGNLHWTPHKGSWSPFFLACPEYCELIRKSWRSTQSYSQRQWELPLNPHIMQSTPKSKLADFFLTLLRVSALNIQIGVVLSPHFRGSWKKFIICEAFRHWSNMYGGKSHREMTHYFEKRSRTRCCKQGLWTSFISPK